MGVWVGVLFLVRATKVQTWEGEAVVVVVLVLLLVLVVVAVVVEDILGPQSW